MTTVSTTHTAAGATITHVEFDYSEIDTPRWYDGKFLYLLPILLTVLFYFAR